jgi:serine/threonine protein kinase/TPR repeat protein
MADTETFQHYSVLKKPDGSLFELGRGAMGVTYKAFDKNLRCHVALKVINATYLDSDMAKQRFLREARSAAGLSHPNVASVFHLGEEGGNYFYAMEFINGETLEAFVRRKGPLPAVLALKITLQVARALRAASREGLVHRDIKPANLMLVHDADDGEEVSDEELHVKVIDFGLAKAAHKEGGPEASATITVAGFVGTPHFASPEQLEEKDLDVRSDIYSLGITLWYMLTGKPPFSGSLASIMGQHIERKPPFEKLSDQPPEAVHLLEHLLEKDPVKRPQTASELRREIEQIIQAINARSTAAATAAASAPVAQIPDTSYPTEAVTSDDALASDPPLTMRAPETGVVLDARYRLLQQIAQGPHGTLFQAMELDSGRPVALKILPPELLPSADAVAFLQREVDCARSAPHPNLLQIFSFEGTRAYNFLTYEWINGFPLVEVLRNRHQLPPAEALRLLEPLASAADHARQNGLPELDFSPAQVLLAFEATLDLPTRTALLGESLTAWPFFRPKIFPLSLATETGSSATWAGQQTIVPVANKAPGALRQLALLAFELLGGAALPAAAGSALRLPPLPVLSEKGNAVLRSALGEQGAETFGNVGQFVQALRGSIGAAEPMGRPSIQPPSIVQSASASRTAPPPLPTHAPTHIPTHAATHIPAPSVAPTLAPPAQMAVRPAARSPLMPVLLVLGVFLVMMAALGVVSFFVWRTFLQKGSGQAGPEPRRPRVSASPTPVLIVESTPPPRFTPAPTPTPRPVATPAPRTNRFKEALAEAQRLDNAGDTMGALAAYVRLAEDPEADQGLSRVDSFIAEMRSKPLTLEIEQRRFPQMRPAMDRAAALGSDQAMLYLADHLIVSDPSAAVNWYRKAADKGQTAAMVALGNLASRGVASLQPEESARWFQMASDKGSVRAKVYLAECYQMAHSGVERDYDKAFQLLNEALNLDSTDERALEKLAISYERGYGTPPDTRKAVSLMKQSADLGNPNAMGNLGVYYMKGLGADSPNARLAASLFKQGADRNNAFCMFNYARCLEGGLGVPKSLAEATSYYRAAAERGFPAARQWCQDHNISFTPK